MLPIDKPAPDAHTSTFAPGRGDTIALDAPEDPRAAFYVGRLDDSLGPEHLGAKVLILRGSTGMQTIVLTDEVIVMLIESFQKLLRSPGAGS